MTLPEFYATGKRKCSCINVKFKIHSIELKQRNKNHRDAIKDIIHDVLIGSKYTIKIAHQAKETLH